MRLSMSGLIKILWTSIYGLIVQQGVGVQMVF